MARLKINYNCYQAHILCLIGQQLSHDEIAKRLKQDFDVDISPRTLRSRLSEWKAPSQRSIFDPSPQIKALIAWFFCDIHTTDANILANLRSLGYNIPNLRLLQQARRAMGLRRRMLNSQVELEKEQLRHILKQHTVDKGPQGNTRSYGCRLLYTYLNSLGDGKKFSRNRIASVMQELDPESIQRRWEEMKAARGEYNIHGPNFVWSIDGYCKVSAAWT